MMILFSEIKISYLHTNSCSFVILFNLYYTRNNTLLKYVGSDTMKHTFLMFSVYVRTEIQKMQHYS